MQRNEHDGLLAKTWSYRAQIIDANGWLILGDLGTLDEEGYVTVRGRSKNLLSPLADRTSIRKKLKAS